METTTEIEFRTTVAARVAAEDIKAEDFVAILSEIVEFPSYLWNGSGATLSAEEPVRSRYIPREAGQPYKVVTVCLPFVYVKPANSELMTLDIRQFQLVRLDADSARIVWKKLRKKKTGQ